MRVTRNWLGGLVPVAAIVLVSACSSNEAEVACTMIGCENGLSIEVNGTLPFPYKVHVRAGGETLHSFDCAANEPCTAFVANHTPREVTIAVETPQGEVSNTYVPEYRTSRPNGPNCPPECRQARIQVNVS